MKRTTSTLTLLILFALLLLGCKERKQASAILNRATAIMEQSPDTALLLLDSIINPEGLPRAMYMEYELRRVQAKDKAYKSITDDSVIFKVAEYFKQKKSVKKLALATFYCGRVYQTQKNYEEATKAYLQANDYAKEAGDENLLGLINANLGNLNYNKMLLDEAIIYYRQAYKYFANKTPRYQNRINPLLSIGNCFLAKEQIDSALYYYNDALNQLKVYNDVTLQSGIYQSLGLAFQTRGDVNKGHLYLQKAASLITSGRTNNNKIYLLLANSFLELGQQDSALFYAQLALHNLDNKTPAITFARTYKILSKIEERSNHLHRSLEYYKSYADKLNASVEDLVSSSVLEIQKKYNMEKIQNENNRLRIIHLWMIIGGLVGLSVALVIIFALYRRQELHRNKLLEANNIIYALRELANTKEQSFKKTLLQELNIVREVQLLSAYLGDDVRKQGKEVIQRVNQIVAGHNDIDWARLYKRLNLQHDGLFDRLRQNFPALDDLQLKICCLTLEELNNDQQAFVLQRSKGYVQNNKSAIRKIISAAEQCDLREALLQV